MKRLTIIVIFIIVLLSLYIIGDVSVDENAKNSSKNLTNDQTQNKKQKKEKDSTSKNDNYVNSDIVLIAYSGEVFSAKVPKGWNVIDNESGLETSDPQDGNTGVSSAVAIGWSGQTTPDDFIAYMANTVGLTNIEYLNVSEEETIQDPYAGYKWVMKTKTFNCKSSQGLNLRIKASTGVINGVGQYTAMLTAFQTTPEKWGTWAPLLERIAKSIMITNPQKAGGQDKVRLPSAQDLANDSSPLMETWEYRNDVQDKTSHDFSDAIMGQESDLISPSTGESYTLPLSAYDPTEGGYHNPNDYSEILVDPYQ